jgi:hypothetical protein
MWQLEKRIREMEKVASLEGLSAMRWVVGDAVGANHGAITCPYTTITRPIWQLIRQLEKRIR